jgi:hypothetical protein
MSSDPEAYFADLDDEEASGTWSRGRFDLSSYWLWAGSALLAIVLVSGGAFSFLYSGRVAPGPEAAAVAVTRIPAKREPSDLAVVNSAVAMAPAPVPSLPSATAPSSPSAPPAPPVPSTADGMRLINSGQIKSGRALLRSMWEKQPTAEIAWSLARSYDPSLLSSISSADAPADVVEAEHWYREWYTIAVKEGLVSGTSSIDRILRTLK